VQSEQTKYPQSQAEDQWPTSPLRYAATESGAADTSFTLSGETRLVAVMELVGPQDAMAKRFSKAILLSRY
jgi:hypothetical protein